MTLRLDLHIALGARRFVRAIRLLGWLLAGLVPLADAVAQSPLRLDDAAGRIEAWPAVTVFYDPGKALGIEDVLRAPARFAPPRSAYATLGLHKEAAWLRIPLSVPESSDGRWILDIDYAVLNRADVHVVAGGRVTQHAVLGNLQPFSQRPLASRSHAVEVKLQPGADAELFLRVQTQGAMVLPITLSKPSAFTARALDEQLLQGLLNGLGLCLLLYSLMQWINLRDQLFIKYALLISGSLFFSVVQFGVGAQYLSTEGMWVERYAAGVSALLASAGTFLFVEHVLAGPQASRLFSRVMHAGAAALALTALAYVAGWVDLHQVSTVVGTVGLMPALMGLPGAVSRARRGDSVGGYFLLAWAGYFVTTATMVGVLKGRIGVDFWTLHSFQIGATLDMLLFMRVIGLRSKAAHAAAQHAAHERDALRSLAHSDALTGVPNRRGLHAALEAAIPACAPDSMLAVYMLDLDGFKQVNDRFGHDVGDELLVAAAHRLQASLRASDLVARLGGDEFVVMAGGLTNEQQAHQVGVHLVDAFRAPFRIGAHHCSVGLTIGYVLAPLDGNDPVGLLKRADAAMYAGKHGGKSCLRRGAVAAAA